MCCANRDYDASGTFLKFCLVHPHPSPISCFLSGAALKGRIQVTFVNQHGVEEAGIDGGGVFKEYMDLLTKRAFDPQYALFLATEDQVEIPNIGCDTLSPLVTSRGHHRQFNPSA